MTELDRIIRTRKSTYPKDYTGADISQEALNEILAVTAYAPNHKKTFPWRFKVYTKEQKNSLAKELTSLYRTHTATQKFSEDKLHKIKSKIDQCSAVIAIIHHVSGKVPEWEEIAAIAMAVQNMWLKATEINVGGYWSTFSLKEHLGEFIQLEANEKCVGLFYLGKTEGDDPLKKYDWKQYVTFVK